jgi:hypothetical protein
MKAIGLLLVGFALVASDVGCGDLNPCSGEGVPCGDGCMPAGNVCCEATDTNCPPNTVCGPDNTCLSSTVNNDVAACEGCVESGEQCCYDDITSGVACAPVDARCCAGTLTYCPAGETCSDCE